MIEKPRDSSLQQIDYNAHKSKTNSGTGYTTSKTNNTQRSGISCHNQGLLPQQISATHQYAN